MAKQKEAEKEKMIELSSLKFNPENPRWISKEQREQIKQSIDGFSKMLRVRPLAYDADRIVIGGNQRLQALHDLGFKSIPANWTIDASFFTEEERARFIIVDNLDAGEWDYVKLQSDWGDRPLEDWGMQRADIDEMPMIDASGGEDTRGNRSHHNTGKFIFFVLGEMRTTINTDIGENLIRKIQGIFDIDHEKALDIFIERLTKDETLFEVQPVDETPDEKEGENEA